MNSPSASESMLKIMDIIAESINTFIIKDGMTADEESESNIAVEDFAEHLFLSLKPEILDGLDEEGNIIATIKPIIPAEYIELNFN